MVIVGLVVYAFIGAGVGIAGVIRAHECYRNLDPVGVTFGALLLAVLWPAAVVARLLS